MLTHARRRSWVTYFLFLQLFLIPIALRNYYSSKTTSSDIANRKSLDTNVIRISKEKEALNNVKETLIEEKEHIEPESFIETTDQQQIVPTSSFIDIESKLGMSSNDIKTKIGM